MIAYKLSDTLYRVPVADYTDGRMADGYVDIGPDHPDFKAWGSFVVPMPGDDDEGDDSGTTSPEPPKGSGGPTARRIAELDRWEQRALSALTRHGSARCRHDRAVIPEEARSAIYTGLGSCATADQVRALFTAWKGEPVEFPPVYHTSAQAWEREQIARKWRERRERAEREV